MVSSAPPALADWDLAARIAWSIASGPLAPRMKIDRSTVAALRADIDDIVVRADRLVRTAADLGHDLPPASVQVVGRREWIQRNLDALAAITAPVADKLAQRPSRSSRRLARQAVAVQIGVVFGYLSTRVLGQYEVFGVPATPEEAHVGRLLLVGPNLLELEATLLPEAGVSPEEFRMGVCLHELAHRLQFEAVDWTKGLLRGLLDEYLSEVDFDPERFRTAAKRLPELLRDPERMREPQTLIELVLTPRQAEVIHQAQSLMSLFEGHGNVCMDWGAQAAQAAGVAHPDPARVREVLNSRRGQKLHKVAQRAMGLSMKAEQYRTGERFILDVAERYGRDTFHEVWRRPANVPTAEELQDPDAWVARLDLPSPRSGAAPA